MHSNDTDNDVFKGFDKPEQNFFRLPNEWTDLTAGVKSLAELKVVEYVARHTWGFSEFDIYKKITLDEFIQGRKRSDGGRLDKGTGLSKPSVIDGIRHAIEHGFLIEMVDNHDRARVKKSYMLKMKQGGEHYSHAREENTDPQDSAQVKNLNAGVKNLYIGGKEPLHRVSGDQKLLSSGQLEIVG